MGILLTRADIRRRSFVAGRPRFILRLACLRQTAGRLRFPSALKNKREMGIEPT